MRAREFLLEYKRDETAKRLGNKLVTVEPNHTDVNEILTQLEAMDPTPNKKYVQWIAKQYITKVDGHLQFRLEDAPQVRQTLQRFEQIKRNLPQKDINKYTYYALEDTVDSAFEVELQQPDQKPQAQQTYEVPEDATVLYNGPLGLLTVPRTPEASCELGKGTSWCTARTDDKNMFGVYNIKSELYIWHDKSGKKYQFYFGAKYNEDVDSDDPLDDFETDIQFMDQKNRPIDKKTINYFRTEHPVLKKMFAQKEAEIIKIGERVVHYARHVIGGRWPEAEPVIARNPEEAVWYAKDAIGGRWPEAEPVIVKDPEAAYIYAEVVIKGRWPEAEPVIAQSPGPALKYALHIIQDRWPAAEPVIVKYPRYAYLYAENVIKGRWPKAEPVIIKNPEAAADYARDVIKDRWPEAEPVIIKDPEAAADYARDVIKDRWPEAEPVIMKDSTFAYRYARDVIKGPWPEAGIK
jgi:hypothetical protein